jgi:hypothetical protein
LSESIRTFTKENDGINGNKEISFGSSNRSEDTAQVIDAIITNETGSIKLPLWNDQINVVKQGDKIC